MCGCGLFSQEKKKKKEGGDEEEEEEDSDDDDEAVAFLSGANDFDISALPDPDKYRDSDSDGR